MQIDSKTTTFSQILDQQKKGGEFEKVDGGKHLRWSLEKGLHTKNDKMSAGIFGNRKEKHENAAAVIKGAIFTEYGVPGLGDRVFKKLGLDNEVKVSDLKKLEPVIVKLLALEHKDKMNNVSNRVIELLPNSEKDPFRSGTDDKVKLSGFEKLQKQEPLELREAAGVLKAIFEHHPVAPLQKLATLIKNEASEKAVGQYTAKYGLQQQTDFKKKGIENEFEGKLPSLEHAQILKEALTKGLSTKEKADLKERVDFIVSAARARGGEEELNGSIKALAISYTMFLGVPFNDMAKLQQEIEPQLNTKEKDLLDLTSKLKKLSPETEKYKEIDQQKRNLESELGELRKASGTKMQDLVTALAIHRGVIFN